MSDKISLKVTFENDIRRLSLNEPSYALLRKTLCKLYRMGEEVFDNTLQVKYKDDENDIITISSDDEFQEAISLTKNTGPILRLFIVKTNPPPSSEQQTTQPQSGRGRRGFGRCWFWKQLNSLFEEGTKESLESARTLLLNQLSMSPNHRRHLYNLSCVESLLGNLEQALDYLEKAIHAGWNNLGHMERDKDLDPLRHLEKYKEIVSFLQKSQPQQQNNCYGFGFPFQPQQQNNCHGFGFPFQPQPQNNCHGFGSPFQPQQQNNCHGFASPFQWHILHQQINNHFANDSVPLYNLACVESLFGNLDSALKFLEEAIQAGYKDVGHIEKDKDLDALRHLEKYKILVASLKNPKPQPWGDLLKNLQEMGFTDQKKNESALSMTQGDLAAAIQLLLKFHE